MSASCLPVSRLDAVAPAPDVALLLPTLYSGGAERVHLNLAQYFVDRGLRVDLVVAKYFGSLKDQVPDGVRLVSLDAGRVLLSLPAYLRYLRRARPPVVCASVENISIVCCLGRMLSRHRHRLAVRLDNSLSEAVPLWRQPRRWSWLAAIAATFPAADLFIAVSKGLVQQLEALPGVSGKPIHLVYNPIIRPDFETRTAEAPVLPATVSPDDRCLVAVGRLHHQKDYPTLLRAFAMAQAEEPAQLLILGEGPERSSLENLARTLGIERSVHFLGYVENPLACMRRAHAFVLSSVQEGFGNVLVEALAAGTPVISTDCPHGPRDILCSGRFGRLVSIGDTAALADAMVAALRTPKQPASPELREHLRQFTVAFIGQRYIDLLALPARDEVAPDPARAAS